MGNHHAHRAFELLSSLPKDYHRMQSIEIGSAATAHALLALGEKIGELVDEQMIANLISAYNAGLFVNPHTDLEGIERLIRDRLGPKVGHKESQPS